MRRLHTQFREKGWIVIDLLDPSPVWKAHAALKKELAAIVGKELELEEYHTVAEEKGVHTEMHLKMAEFFWKTRFGPSIIAAQAPFFQSFLGPDLLVQANPYLRIARPFKKEDNIGYHRDTFYGGSPYELSVFIPFVDLPPESSLSVLSGSHLESEEAFPTKQVESSDPSVVKGSPKHQLGFLYAPKMMDPSIAEKVESVPLKRGQALIFCLSTVHGSVENSGDRTRWSSDIRVLNSFAPVDLSARPDYYEPLSESVVSHCARIYHEKQQRESLEVAARH